MRMSELRNEVIILEPIHNQIFNDRFCYSKEYIMSGKIYSKEEYRTVLANRVLKLISTDDEETPLTQFDKVVYNAVCTLWNFGEKEFSIIDIYRIINGNLKARTNNLNDAMCKEIINSLNKMQKIFISLNCKEEQLNIKEQLLSLEMINNKVNEREILSWKILSEPPLLLYAKLRKKVKYLSPKNFDTHLSMTVSNILLRNFLIERILFINNRYYGDGKSINHTEYSRIMFIEIYMYLNNRKKTEKEKEVILKNCEKLFDFWKNETRILKDWKVDKDEGLFEVEINYDKLPHLCICDYIDIDSCKFSWVPEGYIDMNEIVDALQVLAESGLDFESMLEFLDEISVDLG